MDHLIDAHFFYTPTQANIYTTTELLLSNGSTKLLVATLKREVFCFDYQETSNGALVPASRDVSFTYIPHAAEIIAMDAFNKSLTSNEFVIGIAIIKNGNDSDSNLETYLNIYSEWEESEEFNIDNIAQSCLNVELNFIPYKLLHTYLIVWNDDTIESKEIVFVLSGSDNQIHVFREHTSEHVYKELQNKECFPEFTKTPSPTIWIDIHYSNDFSERMTAFACECGHVKFLKIDVKTNKVIYNFSTSFGNFISKVQIFPENYEKNESLAKSSVLDVLNINYKIDRTNRTQMSLIVVNTVLPAVVFHDVLEYGLSNYSVLPRMDSTSVLTSCEVVDIDFDGEKEILIGSSSEEVLLFKRDKNKSWWLEELKRISSPILGLKCIDMSGDGVKDLVILSMKGIHILQHDLDHVQEILDRKIENLICSSNLFQGNNLKVGIM